MLDLARNFIYDLNFLDTIHYYRNKHIHATSLYTDLQLLFDLRSKHPRNFLFGYLNVYR